MEKTQEKTNDSKKAFYDNVYNTKFDNESPDAVAEKERVDLLMNASIHLCILVENAFKLMSYRIGSPIDFINTIHENVEQYLSNCDKANSKFNGK